MRAVLDANVLVSAFIRGRMTPLWRAARGHRLVNRSKLLARAGEIVVYLGAVLEKDLTARRVG